jgi:hypothetical protein
MSKLPPLNSAVPNALWIYDAMVEPRFLGAPTGRVEAGIRDA